MSVSILIALVIVSISVVVYVLLRSGLRFFNFLKWLLEKERGVRFLNWVYKGKFGKKRIDNYLEKIVKREFKFEKTYKVNQNKHSLTIATKRKRQPWEYSIRNKNKRWKSKKNKNYNYIVLIDAQRYQVLKLTRK